jgi:hypothetical protein
MMFGRWANSPTSTMGSIQQPSAVEGEVIQIEPKAFSTSFYATKVPNNYRLKSSNEFQTGPILAQTLYSSASSEPGLQIADQLGISVGEMPPEGLQGVSAVMFRSRKPDLYQPMVYDWLPSGSVAFSQIGSDAEISVFMTEDSRYASVVVSGSSARSQPMTDVLKNVIQSWQWK